MHKPTLSFSGATCMVCEAYLTASLPWASIAGLKLRWLRIRSSLSIL